MADWTAYIPSLKGYYNGGIEACGIFGQNGGTWAQENGLNSLEHFLTVL